MLFEGNDFDFEIPLVTDKIVEDDKKILDSKEGFLRGNMFESLYEPYKDMTYIAINPTNKKEELLYKIMEIDFAINDLNLYLDLYPEDEKIYKKFKMYTEECMKLKDEYSKVYGPLVLEQTDYDKYKWLDNTWPWDMDGGSMYV